MGREDGKGEEGWAGDMGGLCEGRVKGVGETVRVREMDGSLSLYYKRGSSAISPVR